MCVLHDQNLMQREDVMVLNFEGFEIQKWNKPTNRAPSADEKNGVICLDIMFTPKVMVF